MEPLNSYDVRQLVLSYSKQYKDEVVKEIELMTAIIDPSLNKIKTPDSQYLLKQRLYR